MDREHRRGRRRRRGQRLRPAEAERREHHRAGHLRVLPRHDARGVPAAVRRRRRLLRHPQARQGEVVRFHIGGTRRRSRLQPQIAARQRRPAVGIHQGQHAVRRVEHGDLRHRTRRHVLTRARSRISLPGAWRSCVRGEAELLADAVAGSAESELVGGRLVGWYLVARYAERGARLTRRSARSRSHRRNSASGGRSPQHGQQPTPSCEACAEWNRPQAPFQIFANTYYVGPRGLSAILITSEQGHVLIDGALPESAAAIASSVRALGFKVEDIRLIVNSHVHFDHAGGIAELQRMSGATVAATAWSASVLTSGVVPPSDPQFGVVPLIAPVAKVRTSGTARPCVSDRWL